MTPDNPDVVWLEDGSLQLTLVIDAINSDYRGVKIEGHEATAYERNEARAPIGTFPTRTNPFTEPHWTSYRGAFNIPLVHAVGYGIGSTIVVTIRKVGAA